MLSGRPLPRMGTLQRIVRTSPPLDVRGVVAREMEESGVLAKIRPGARVAVGVGSRGITGLATIVREVILQLSAAGARPFVVPAMGSHGGATPEGQMSILAHYGITEAALGVPIEASMEVEQVGETEQGRPVWLSTASLRADGIVVVNRVKPHTDFTGDLGSGIQKMLAVGLGKRRGAATLHEEASVRGHAAVIRDASRTILSRAPVLCGVAVVEGSAHETVAIRVLRPASLEAEERLLLEEARERMPRLPFRGIDLLVIDQMGKDVSGAGMDPNVIGRGVLGYSSALHEQPVPIAHRIFVRDLSPGGDGNAVGIGMADFTTTRLVEQIDYDKTYLNALTAVVVQLAKTPMHFPTDREVVEKALDTLALRDRRAARVVRIADTLSLDRLEVSEACLEESRDRDDLVRLREPREMAFDAAGNLPPLDAE